MLGREWERITVLMRVRVDHCVDESERGSLC